MASALWREGADDVLLERWTRQATTYVDVAAQGSDAACARLQEREARQPRWVVQVDVFRCSVHRRSSCVSTPTCSEAALAILDDETRNGPTGEAADPPPARSRAPSCGPATNPSTGCADGAVEAGCERRNTMPHCLTRASRPVSSQGIPPSDAEPPATAFEFLIISAMR